MGVAAHITAARPRGARYDASLSREERKSASNGLWLCVYCAKLVDSDPERYTVAILLGWKAQAEDRAREQVEGAAIVDDRRAEPEGAGPLDGQAGRDTALLLLAKIEDRISEQVPADVSDDLARMRLAYLNGRDREALCRLRDLKANWKKWDALPPHLKVHLVDLETFIEPSEDNFEIIFDWLLGKVLGVDYKVVTAAMLSLVLIVGGAVRYDAPDVPLPPILRVPDVEGRWTGDLALSYGSGYVAELDLAQDGEDLSGTGTLLARDAGEDDVPVEVAEGSRVDGEALDLVLRDASGYSGLRIDLQGTAEDERIEADGTFGASTQTGENDIAAGLKITL